MPKPLLALLFALIAAPHALADTAGVAKVDITPSFPVRLNGFGGRRTESEGVYQRIWAKSLAFQSGDKGDPCVLITVDVLGIPGEIFDEVAKRLAKKANLKPERLAITATHTHTGPMLTGANPTLFGLPIPKEHLSNIDRYTVEFIDKLESVALAALADRKEAKFAWATGSVGFAKNRRGRGGPVDHDLPVLFVTGPDGKVRAVWTSYACHCVTLSLNKIGGDWAGYAQTAIEDQYPGAVALVSVGCGADADPDSGVTGGNLAVAARQGETVAKEVERLRASGHLAKLSADVTASRKTIELPLEPLPTLEGWKQRESRGAAVGHHATVQMAKLARGESLATKITYPVSTWAFGDQLAVAFLPGEVVADYSRRLKRELDGRRLWVNAYANDDPCYIPSEQVRKEGGYEAGDAMVYYDVPTPFKPGLEQPIIEATKSQLVARFAPPIDANKTNGSLPLTPLQSLATMRTRPNLAVELVAAEPLLSSPVAIDFGPDGRLWVAEMFDYPDGKTGKFDAGGRVSFLEDTDDDGVFDKATPFVRDIPFPTGVTAWREGVLICAAPDILFAEDADGDGKPERVEKLFSGFGTGNYQARVNSLEYGLDGWVYGSCGLFGGDITSHKTGKVHRLGDRDFRFKPDTGEFEPATGRTQQGRVRNDWGDWFGCDNSNLGRHYTLEDHHLRRNPHAGVASTERNLINDGGRLYPASTQLQMFKFSGPSGRATAACGIGVYRDNLLGAEFTGNLFTCEPVNLLVHRRKLVPTGATFTGVRADDEKDSEFLASTDTWFRPVQARTGPDRGLWVVDMHRFVIEHSRWIPKDDAAKLDLRAGDGMGRIYRVRPKGVKLPKWPRLDKMDDAALTAALDTPNGWQRDMAAKVIAWRGTAGAVKVDSGRPGARLAALALNAERGKLDAEMITNALKDAHPGVRRHAVRLARMPDDGPAVAALAGDGDAFVRVQVAYAIGGWKDARAGAVLAELARRDEPILSEAVMSSVNAGNLAFVLEALLKDGEPPAAFVRQLLATAAATASPAELGAILAPLARKQGGKFQPWQFAGVAGLLDRLPESQRAPLEPILSEARKLAADAKTPEAERLAALPLLGRTDLPLLAGLLEPSTSAAVQSAAIAAIARTGDDKVPSLLLVGWPSHTPAVRSVILDALMAREAWTVALLDAIEKKAVFSAHLDTPRRQRLINGKATAARAAKVFAGSVDANRQRVIDAYAPVATSGGDAVKGKLVFGRVCAACHALEGVGHNVGPDLAASATKSPASVLLEVLDPNRNLDSRYLEYQAATKAGKVVTGVLAAENATAITLRGQQAKDETVLRTDIDELASTGRSLMPEGLEKDVTPRDMADLLTYLGRTEVPPKAFAGNAPAVVRPADGVLKLTAVKGEIRGSEIVFERDFDNIGYWHGPDDRVTWRVRLDADAAFDVWLDYSCANNSSGNRFAFEGGDSAVTGAVPGTGESWANYTRLKVGATKLKAGDTRLTLRPEAPPRGALMDLRAVYLTPVGKVPPSATPAPVPVLVTPADIAKRILDESSPQAEREKLTRDHIANAGAIVAAMTSDMPNDAKEEYRRIPWVWRVSIAAGRADDAEALRKLLDAALPKKGETLRDWQAVVVGGVVINGWSLDGKWPTQRAAALLKGHPELAARWSNAVERSFAMADDAKVPTGTRYDALRMVAMSSPERSVPLLAKYLAEGTNAELQQGAVSGLADVESDQVAALLVKAIPHLPAGNRKFAIDALSRTPERKKALADAVKAGAIGPQ